MSPVSPVLHTEVTVIIWLQGRIRTEFQTEVNDPYPEHTLACLGSFSHNHSVTSILQTKSVCKSQNGEDKN